MNAVHYSIVQSTNKTYVQCLTEHEDDLGIISSRRGFIQVNEKKAPALLAKLQAGEVQARFGRPNRDGLSAMTVSIVGQEEETETAPEGELVTQA